MHDLLEWRPGACHNADLNELPYTLYERGVFMNVNHSGEDRYILVDQMCQRLSNSWREGKPIRIEDLLEDVPEPLRNAVLEDLIAEECELRLKVGQPPKFSEYEARFKDRVAAVQRGFRQSDEQSSTVPHDPTVDYIVVSK